MANISDFSRDRSRSVTERLIFGMGRHKTIHRLRRFMLLLIKILCNLWMVFLDSVADGALEVCAVVAAEGELLAVFHDDAVLTVEPRLHFLDPIYLHDR